MTDAVDLDQLFAPYSFAEFRQRFWAGLPSVAHGAVDRMSELLDAARIHELVARSPAPTKSIGHNAEGGYFERVIGLPQLPISMQGDESLCIGAVHEVIPAVKRLVWEFALGLGIPIQMTQCNAYWSPANRGLPAHFDDHEIVVIQLEGAKRWEVGQTEQCRFAGTTYLANQPVPDDLSLYYGGGSPTAAELHCIDLLPGSTLFLPRGTWHRTTALEESFSLTIGLYPPSASALVMEAVRRRLLCSPAWRRPLAPFDADDEMQAELARLLQRLGQDVGPLSVSDILEFGQRVTGSEARSA